MNSTTTTQVASGGYSFQYGWSWTGGTTARSRVGWEKGSVFVLRFLLAAEFLLRWDTLGCNHILILFANTQYFGKKFQCQTPESGAGREVFGEVGAFGISKRRTASASTWEEGYVCCLRFTGAVRNLSDLSGELGKVTRVTCPSSRPLFL